jgi:hypothetical protein
MTGLIMTNQHEMYKVRTHDSGNEEWQCSECDRRLVFEVGALRRVVLDEGNSLAQHFGYGMDLELSSEVASGGEDKTTLH